MRFLFSVLTLLALSHQVFSQASDPRLTELKSEIKHLMEAYHAVGLSVAIVEDNKVIYIQGFGYADLEKKSIVTPSTSFLIGSVTKQFTSTLIGIFEGKGLLAMQDQPKDHFPELDFYSDEMNNLIRIEDLLTHHSGIGNVDGTSVFFPPKSKEEYFGRLNYLVPNSTVRERFDYSNMGYAILGAIGENVTKQSWEDNIKEDIFAPLEMNNSTASLTDFSNHQNASLGYSNSGDISINVLPEELHFSAPSGAIGSTAVDMAKWVQTLLNRGKYKSKSVIPESFLEQAFGTHSMIRSDFIFDEQPDLLYDSYGYGWFVHSFKNKYKVSHGGAVSGFTAHMEIYPYEQLGIVVLTNQHLSGIASDIADIMANRMLELDRQDWNEYEVRVPQARVFNSYIPPININNPPSFLLDRFVGSYNNKGYGTLIVSLEDDTLFVTLPAFKMALIHEEGNNFRTKSLTEIHQNSPNFLYQFLTDEDGIISEIEIALQAESVKFIRVID